LSQVILYERRGPVGWVTLNNVNENLTLTLKAMKDMEKQLKTIANTREVAVVVLQGAPNIFCLGHHFQEIQESDTETVHALFEQSFRVKQLIRDLPQVVIAKVQGVAVAAGLELVAVSDLAVASERAQFGATGINWGLFCSTPAVFLSRNISRKKAAEMLFTGKLLTAREAEAMELVNRVVPDDQLDKETEKLANEVAKHSLQVIELGKRLFYRQLQMDDWSALHYATEVIVRNSKHRETIKGISAFLEKKEPTWDDGVSRHQ
jgi:enoyl-CoA hydratase/carnithine racemase